MKIWLFANSAVMAVISGVLFLVIRQIGYLLARFAQVPARATSAGPRIGENLSAFCGPLWMVSTERRAKLIIFGSDTCSICKRIRDAVPELAKRWRREAEIYLVYDCGRTGTTGPVEMLARGLFFKRDCDLRQRVGATFVPFAIVTDADGIVRGKGLVNDVSHVESLLELERAKRREDVNDQREEVA